ncbi:MAG: hypothetical protein JXR68_07630 [Bacteroidales bacterium]|nr:hypothetical protein [Bacteroidales bacterium]
MENNKSEQIISILKEKGKLKQQIFDITFSAFKELKKILSEIEKEYNKKLEGHDSRVRVEYKNAGLYQCELKIAGDVLVFYMHTNIFEFDREHKIWSLQKTKIDSASTYSGIISIYNFLSDSFKYTRIEDYGYLIARIFINHKDCFFVEGKQQMGYLSNDFGENKIDKEAIKGIVESAMLYSQKFDLLVPPYDAVKIVNVQQILESRKQGIPTGKRLGFSFNSDDISG